MVAILLMYFISLTPKQKRKKQKQNQLYSFLRCGQLKTYRTAAHAWCCLKLRSFEKKYRTTAVLESARDSKIKWQQDCHDRCYGILQITRNVSRLWSCETVSKASTHPTALCSIWSTNLNEIYAHAKQFVMRSCTRVHLVWTFFLPASNNAYAEAH